MNALGAVLAVAVLAGLFWLGWRSKPPPMAPDEPAKPAAPAFSIGTRLAGLLVAFVEAIGAALLVLAISEWAGHPLPPAVFTYWGAWALVGLSRPDWVLAPFSKAWRFIGR